MRITQQKIVYETKKYALSLIFGSSILSIVYLSLFIAVSPLESSHILFPLRVPKLFAQEIPDGENIAPSAGELFTNDSIISHTIPFLSDTVLQHGPRDTKQIALTFDADMTPLMKASIDSGVVTNSFDTRVIHTLEKTQTKATFFLTGMWIEMYESQVKKLAENSLFAFGNHSYSHPSFNGSCYGLTLAPDAEDIKEIEQTQSLLKLTTGIENKFFRFPGGCYSLTDLRIVTNEAGLEVVHWDVVGNDGFNDDTSQIEHNVTNHVQNGSIIVLHLNGAPNAPRTADALPRIIATLKKKGYTFVTIPELLHIYH